MLLRGDLVKSADEESSNALKIIEGVVRLNIKQNKSSWPKVLLYANRSFKKKNIPECDC